LPSSKNFINAGRHTHSNAQLKGRAMQFHAAHYGSPPHWVAWHKTQDSIRFYTTSFHTTKILKCNILKWGCILITNTYNVQVMAIWKLQIKLSKWFLTIESSCRWVNLIPIEEKNIYAI
jgi:hypothetical protein